LHAPALCAVTPESNCLREACLFGHGASRRSRRRRYTSDMTDAEWAIVEPLMPFPARLKGRGGRPEQYCQREVADAIGYVVDNGIKWRNLQVDFPPWRTVHAIFTRWCRD
jgi:hypothetical protein